MGRRYQDKDWLRAAYLTGSPKRILVTLRSVGREPLVASLTRMDARSAASMLIDAIDRLEADKIALRGDPTAKRERPKRSTKPGRGRPGLTTRRDIRPPSRLQRVEVAAITLASLLSTHDGDSEIGRALRALEEALSNKKGFER